MLRTAGWCLGWFGLVLGLLPEWGQCASVPKVEFDIAPFARRCCVEDRHVSPLEIDYGEAELAGNQVERAPEDSALVDIDSPRPASEGRYVYGLQWAEERDLKEIRVRFKAGSVPGKATIEYWNHNWPTTEDLRDDPWQGKWLRAATKVACEGSECRYTFQPLEEAENPLAKNLPGVNYRRTLKVRLLFASDPVLDGVQVFTGSILESVKMRIELGAGEQERYEWKGDLDVYNGGLKDVKLWKGAVGDTTDGKHFRMVTDGSPKGLLVELAAAKPSLPGSEDITIVTLEAGERTFSFAVPDLERGPIYVAVFHGYVSLASDERTFSPSIVKVGLKIRERIPQEPEQSYERASREIPPLNPAEATVLGGHIYFPLAAEASWQKFGVEWGGNVFVSKWGIRAKGAGELERLQWKGDRIYWRIGTGATPNYRPGWKDSTLSVLHDYIPVTIAKWTTEGISYTEESFATLLSGPLSPDDAGRSEETPAVLMMKVEAQNPGSAPAMAHLWLATDPDEEVRYENGELVAAGEQLVRAQVKLPEAAQARVAAVPYGDEKLRGMHVEIALGANERRSVFISLPMIPRLSVVERTQLAELDYDAQRTRIVNYWQEIVDHGVTFGIPDEKITKLAKALVPHILMTVTKQPQSGLYISRSGIFRTAVASNEGVRECLELDALGQPHRAAEYLETWVRLQGTQPIPGTFSNQWGAYNLGRSDEGASLIQDGAYTSPGYSLNPGYVLRGLAEHYLFTRDKEWLQRVAPSMMRAADWMIEQRKLTEVLDEGRKVPEYGLLPAGRLEDPPDWGHWIAVNAEAVAGVTRLAQVLADIEGPEAAHYAAEAEAYKQDLRDATIRAYQRAAVIRLRDNIYVPYVPNNVYQRTRHLGPIHIGYNSRFPNKVAPIFVNSIEREVYAGPILLFRRDVFSADEPLADWLLDDWEDNTTMSLPLGVDVHGWVDEKDWFSRGGMVFEPGSNPAHAYLRRNEIPAAIRTFYNGLVTTYYPDVNAVAEEIHRWGHMGSPIKTADEARLVEVPREMLVLEDGGTLWLAAGSPRRWLAPGKKIDLQNAPTYFGPVSYRMEATESGVDARVELPTRNKIGTAWLVVRAPAGKKIHSVKVDGRPWSDFDAATERIHLPVADHALQISVRF